MAYFLKHTIEYSLNGIFFETYNRIPVFFHVRLFSSTIIRNVFSSIQNTNNKTATLPIKGNLQKFSKVFQPLTQMGNVSEEEQHNDRKIHGNPPLQQFQTRKRVSKP